MGRKLREGIQEWDHQEGQIEKGFWGKNFKGKKGKYEIR